MVKKEIDKLREFLEKFETTITKAESCDATEQLYEFVSTAHYLYGSELNEVENAYDEILQCHGLLLRNSKVILAALNRYLVRKENDFEDGIMPITYENLIGYPKAQAAYKAGIEKYKCGQYDRNVLDDMRVTLEELLRQVLHNDMVLENQIPILGTYLKNYNVEIRKLFTTTISYLKNYQNNNVKHHDKVLPAEVNYVIEQTSAIVNFLVRIDNGGTDGR